MNLPRQSMSVIRNRVTAMHNDSANIRASYCDGDPARNKCENADPNSDQYVCCGFEACCCAQAGLDAKCCYPGQPCYGSGPGKCCSG
jgi:hypothetical protein